MSGRAWRLPMLLLLPVLLVVAVVVQGRTTTSSAGPRLDRLGPTAPAAGAAGSTWYCAAGSATGVATGADAGIAEHTVSVLNTTDRVASGTIVVYPSEGPPQVRAVDVAPHSRRDLVLSEIAKAPWASAVVEMQGSGAAVEHQLRGPGGRSVGPCATTPSARWWFPAGTTRAGTRNLVALFNPFPGAASVDLSFRTEDGTRTPQQFQGVVVPGGKVTVVDVSPVVTLREQLATTVTARNGRVVAEQLMVSDGTDASPKGLTSVLGAPTTATAWTFPDGTAPSAGFRSQVAVMNPGDADASVEVQVFLDDPATNGSVEPFTLDLPPQSDAVADLFADGRIPAGVGYWILVRSTNGTPVVAERLEGGSSTSGLPGLSATIGTPLVAGEWAVPVAVATTLRSAAVMIVNPSATGEARVSLETQSDGVAQPLAGTPEVVVPAGGRVVVPLPAALLKATGLSLVVRADQPVVVARSVLFDEKDLAGSIAVPVSGTESLAADLDLARPEAFAPAAPVTDDGTGTGTGG